MILKFIREIKERCEFEESVFGNVKYYYKTSTNTDNKFNSNIFIKFTDGEELNLILVDDNRDVYNAVYLMNEKGQTTEKII